MGDYGTSSEDERSMGRFMERFEQHMANDPELRAEYERLGPRFGAVSASIKARSDAPARRPIDRGDVPAPR